MAKKKLKNIPGNKLKIKSNEMYSDGVNVTTYTKGKHEFEVQRKTTPAKVTRNVIYVDEDKKPVVVSIVKSGKDTATIAASSKTNARIIRNSAELTKAYPRITPLIHKLSITPKRPRIGR
jgi:hypothetical protein